ncbi:MAG: RidA family protein [Chloroflexi bacterium]|nr:RidA family protein [Chloroflexota bacterium]
MAIERIQPDGLNHPTAYTHVVRVGNLIFLAGQTATDSSGKIVGVGDFDAQADQVYQNMRAALASVGATFKNVVKTTTYLTRPGDIEAYRNARVRHMPADLPASTLVFISRLASPDYLIEIEAVAALD